MQYDDYNAEEVAWLNTLFQTIAHRVATQQRFREHVEADDLFQQAWEWMMRNRKKYLRWEQEAGDQVEDLERRVIAVLTNELTHHARQERANHVGYRASDEFFYDKEMLEELVKAALDPDAWLNPPKLEGDQRRGAKAPNEGNGWLAALSDVSSGLNKLSIEDRMLLQRRHLDDWTVGNLADQLGITERQVYHRLESAIKRLWSHLGGPQWLKPKDVQTVSTGRRRAISNAHSRAITSNDWNPE